jgi:thiamine-phosphate pyrophosphorylase
LGLDDVPVRSARRLLGDNKIIGGTAHNLKEALKAEREGADYIGYGHIFNTRSKIKSTRPVGPGELAEICKQVKTKIIAVGGIDLHNVKQVIEAGAFGIAVIGAVAKADDPLETVKKLRGIVYA